MDLQAWHPLIRQHPAIAQQRRNIPAHPTFIACRWVTRGWHRRNRWADGYNSLLVSVMDIRPRKSTRPVFSVVVPISVDVDFVTHG